MQDFAPFIPDPQPSASICLLLFNFLLLLQNLLTSLHQNRQTGIRNLMGPKTLPTIWGTYMNLVTKYQISAINSCWEKCDKKWTYIFNVYKNQQSRQTGSRNLLGPKTLPTIWGTYMKLVTKNVHICSICIKTN
jgi:hypothetical protein